MFLMVKMTHVPLDNRMTVRPKETECVGVKRLPGRKEKEKRKISVGPF